MLKKFFVFSAIFLIFIFASSRDGPHKASFANEETKPRKVKVIALIDKDLLETNPGVTKEVSDTINFVSEIFKKEFNVVFEVTRFEPWSFPSAKTEVNINEALSDVAIIANNQSQSDDEIFIGFSLKFLFLRTCDQIDGKTVCSKEKKDGYAYILGNAAVIGLDYNSKYIALHEIGHLFGATHTDEKSIMNKEIDTSIEFDEKNKEIIKKNKEISFPKIYAP